VVARFTKLEAVKRHFFYNAARRAKASTCSIEWLRMLLDDASPCLEKSSISSILLRGELRPSRNLIISHGFSRVSEKIDQPRLQEKKPVL
jgi:hypothetical protein